jgi:hypothetical protein
MSKNDELIDDLRKLVESFSECSENNVRKGTEDDGFYEGVAVGRVRSAHELAELVEEYE